MPRIRPGSHLTVATAILAAVFALLLLMGSAGPAFAVSRHIRGTVRDGEGAGVAGAGVSVTGADGTPIAVATGAGGSYDLVVPAGSYRVSASAPSFIGSRRAGLVAAVTADRNGIDFGLVRRPEVDASSALTTFPASPGERPVPASDVRIVGDRVTWFQAGDPDTGGPGELWTRLVGDPAPSLVATVPSLEGVSPYDVNSTHAFVSEALGVFRYDLVTHERSAVDTSAALPGLIDEGPVAGDRWLCWTEFDLATGRSTVVVRDLTGGPTWRWDVGAVSVSIAHGSLSGNYLAVGLTNSATAQTYYRIVDVSTRALARGMVGPLTYQFLQEAPVLLGKTMFFQHIHGDSIIKAEFSGALAPAQVLVSTMNAAWDPIDGYAATVLFDLTAQGHRVTWLEGRLYPGPGQYPWLVRSWDAGAPSASAVTTIASSTSFGAGIRSGGSDVSGERFAWVDPAGWGSVGGTIQSRLATETDSARMDETATLPAGQRQPMVGTDKVFWLDDRAYPADAQTFDVYQRPFTGGAESLVATDVSEWGSTSCVSGDHVTYFKRYANTAKPAELWVRDTGTGIATLVKRAVWTGYVRTELGGACVTGDWLYYVLTTSDWRQNGAGIFSQVLAQRLSTGEKRTVGTFDPFGDSAGDLYAGTNGRLVYEGPSGLLVYDPSTNRSTAAYPGWSAEMNTVMSWPYALTSNPGVWQPATISGFSYLTATTATGRVFTVDPAPSLGDEVFALDGTTGVLGDDVYDMRTGVYYDLGYSADVALAGSGDPVPSPLRRAHGVGERWAFGVLDETGASRVVACDLASVLWNPTQRLAGASRYGTSVQLSQDMTSAATVVIATGMSFPDALSGGPLAHALGAPILLVEPNRIPADVLAEIERLGATKAVILGGTGAVGTGVQSALDGAGVIWERIGGAGRYETSALIARRLKKALGGGQIGEAFMATGAGYADALAASPVAARMGAPILLTPTAGLSPSTITALSSLDTTHAVILGGTGAVSSRVVSGLSSLGITSERLAGGDRYSTADAIARYGLTRGLTMDEAVVATGLGFPDALGAGTYAARAGVNLLLVNNNLATLPPGVEDLLRTHRSEVATITIVGGEGSVWLPLQQQAAQAIFTPK
jgi:putative cell wall-binding protein